MLWILSWTGPVAGSMYKSRPMRYLPLDLFGIRIPLSLISLSSVSSGAGKGSPVRGAEIIAACGFPSSHRTPSNRPLFQEREKQYTEEKEKERPVQVPE